MTSDGTVTVVDDLASYNALTNFDAASFFADKLSNELMEKMKATDNLIIQNEILTDLYSVPTIDSIDKFGKVKFKLSSDVMPASFQDDGRRLRDLRKSSGLFGSSTGTVTEEVT